MTQENDETHLTPEFVEESFGEFSIDDDLERKFNEILTNLDHYSINYQAYKQAREIKIQCLDND